jgi:methionyl-tRNA formyltransferase
VHASLLPRWRGAAPIQAAILTGDQVTGATIMRMDEGLDTGPIISQNEIEISITETAGSLSQKLSLGGAELLMKTLPSYLAGKIEEQKQDDSKSTYAPMLKKANGQLDFSLSASALEKQIRAYNPWPGTFANIHGHSIKIHRAKSLVKKAGKIGQLAILENYPAIASKDSWLLLTKLQPPGKRTMDGEDFLRGGRKWEGFATI